MDCHLNFQGKKATEIEKVSGISADKLYEMRGALAKYLATKPKSEAVFRAARDTIEGGDGLDDVSISDMWYYGMYMNYIDLYEGSEQSAMQSWRPVSGKALEMLLEWFYDTKTPEEISVRRVTRDQRQTLATAIDADGWESNADGKLDLIVGCRHDGEWYVMGGIHVKPSFKGRTHHDVKFSQQLIDNGMYSPIVTLDIWSPDNKLENEGQLNSESGIHQEPREFVEESGEFTNMYSFNDDTETSTGDTSSGFAVKEKEAFVDDVVSFAEEFVQRDDLDQFAV